jgi:hypothetical protein
MAVRQAQASPLSGCWRSTASRSASAGVNWWSNCKICARSTRTAAGGSGRLNQGASAAWAWPTKRGSPSAATASKQRRAKATAVPRFCGVRCQAWRRASSSRARGSVARAGTVASTWLSSAGTNGAARAGQAHSRARGSASSATRERDTTACYRRWCSGPFGPGLVNRLPAQALCSGALTVECFRRPRHRPTCPGDPGAGFQSTSPTKRFTT